MNTPGDTDHRTLLRGGPRWPEGFASIDVEPARLWLRGRDEILERPRRVAIVGSRAPTPYGAAQARHFGRRLARRGIVIVSGLARGVDAAAHEGALDAGGDTVAVLGCGVDRPWPSGPLATRIAREGLMLSEYAPGVAPRRHHFPMRNRIIAALADAVLVVEAAHASGSLITARWAADQGQCVFALPGRIDHPMARGTLRLIREGATPIDSPEMLLEDLYGETRGGVPDEGSESDSVVLRALRGETLSAGEVAEATGRDLGEVLAELTTLEMDGRVRRMPGGLFAIE